MSRRWDLFFRAMYRGLTAIGPAVRAWVSRFGLGNTVVLTVPGRRSGRQRAVVLGLIRVDGGWYLGHPNGDTAWTQNLRAAGRASLRWPGQPPVEVEVEELPPGDERRRVVTATWHQHPFPGNLVYWLARRHVMATGRYFRLEIVPNAPD